MNPDSPFNKLYEAVQKRKLETVLTLYRRGKKTLLRIEARSIPPKNGNPKIIDYEEVRSSETVEAAADRMHRRLKRDKVVS